MTNKPSVWARIVIVAFNSGDVLQTCLNHLSVQTDTDFEVVIVDNLSTDGSVDNLVLPDERFHILRSKTNSGFAGGSNQGVVGAQTEWIFTLNPDAWVEKDWLENCKQAARENPQYAMLSPLLLRASDRNLIDGCGDVLSIYGHSWRGGHLHSRKEAPENYCETFSPCGACAGYKRDVFLKANGFDESFFCYKEDVDLGLRLRRAGERALFIPDAIVWHVGSSTLGERHPFILYHSHRNTLFMIAKNFPILNLLLALPLFSASILWILARNLRQKGNVDILKGMTVGLAYLPLLLILRVVNKFRKNARQTVFYMPMISSRTALRNSAIITWICR